MSVDQLIREGKQLFDGGQIPDAIAKWQQVLLREPGHREAQDLIRGARGAQRSVPGERTQSLRAFTEGLQDSEMSRRLADEKLKNGNLLLKAGRTAEAIESLQAAHELDRAREEITLILARAKEQYLLDEKVEEIFQAGMANLQTGQHMEAVTKFLRVLAVDEKHVRARAALDKAKSTMAASSESGGAVAAFEGGGNKERAKELFRLGVEAYKRDNLKDAIQLWQEVVQLDPEHPRAYKYREKAMATLAKQSPQEPPPPISWHDVPAAPLPPPPEPEPEPEPDFSSPSFFDEPLPALQSLPPGAGRVEETVEWDVPSSLPARGISGAAAVEADPFAFGGPSTPGSFDFSAPASSDPFEFGPPPGDASDAFDFGPPPGEPSEPFLFESSDVGADPFGSAAPVFGQSAPVADPFDFGSKPAPRPKPPAPPARSAAAPAQSSTPFDDFLPHPPSSGTGVVKDPFSVSDVEPDSPFVDFAPEPDTEALFGTTGGPRPGSISTTAADFLDEVRAAPAHSAAPPPSWISGESFPPEAPSALGPEAMLEEGRRSMAEERYEEAIHTFKKAMESYPDNTDARGLLERAVNCLSSRDQLTVSLSQAEQAVAAQDWELASRHANRVLQLNPYLRRAQES